MVNNAVEIYEAISALPGIARVVYTHDFFGNILTANIEFKEQTNVVELNSQKGPK